MKRHQHIIYVIAITYSEKQSSLAQGHYFGVVWQTLHPALPMRRCHGSYSGAVFLAALHGARHVVSAPPRPNFQK